MPLKIYPVKIEVNGIMARGFGVFKGKLIKSAVIGVAGEV